MKLKLDENLGERGRRALRDAGHDVSTVLEQGLASASDRELLSRCVADGRALVTLDPDFANVVVFAPHQHVGLPCYGCRESRGGLTSTWPWPHLWRRWIECPWEVNCGSSKPVGFVYTRRRAEAMRLKRGWP